MTGSKLSYDFGRKNQWRKWVWNNFAERIPHNRNKAVILYLAGKDDLDRKVAEQKGFDPNNLIAVDRDIKNVKNIRVKKNLAINGDLTSVIKCWKAPPLISGIHADFCCGLNKYVMGDFMLSLLCGVFKPCATICINFLRGRDHYSQAYRDYTATHWKRLGYNNENNDFLKHRGKQFLSMFARWLAYSELISIYHGPGKRPAYSDLDPRCKLPECVPFMFLGAEVQFAARYSRYRAKNSNAFMDSVIFSLTFDSDEQFVKDEKIKRQVAAIKAIRSMRSRKSVIPA